MTQLREHFTQQIYEPCPFCSSNEKVFVGHGSTRHCTTCVLSWGDSEAETLRWQQQAEMSEAAKKELPDAVKKSIREAAKGLTAISDLKERLKRLRSISDEEWQEAVGFDAA